MNIEILDNIQKLSTKIECNKDTLSHRIHKNILASLRKKQLDYNNIAYYNYFLRPATFGKTLNVKEKDREVAKNVFDQIKKTINPSLIIFVSKKAYLSSDKNAHYVQHPTCHWWYRKSNDKKYGREKFEKILDNFLNKNHS